MDASDKQSSPQLTSMRAFQLLLILIATAILIGGFLWARPLAENNWPLFAAYLIGSILLAVFFLSMVAILHILGLQIQQQAATQKVLQELVLGLKNLSPTVIPPAAIPPVVVPHPTVAERNANQASGAGLTPELSASTDQQMLEILKQLRDLMMMNDTQRSHAAQQHFEKRKDYLVKQIDRALATSHWQTAEEHIRELQRILPDDPTGNDLSQRLEEEKSTRLHQDIEAGRIQLRHLISITAWQQAEELVAGLQQRYPSALEIQELTTEVQLEKQTFEHDHLQQLITDLKDATDHRQWRKAVGVAEELIRRYPSEKQVERLRVDLPTLQENAEAQDRKEQEAQFKDFLHRQRYHEALSIAKTVISKYPSSSAALELSKLTPKVEELIAQEKLKRQPAVT